MSTGSDPFIRLTRWLKRDRAPLRARFSTEHPGSRERFPRMANRSGCRVDPLAIKPCSHPAHISCRWNDERKTVADIEAAVGDQPVGSWHAHDCCQAVLLREQRDHFGRAGCVLIHQHGYATVERLAAKALPSQGKRPV